MGGTGLCRVNCNGHGEQVRDGVLPWPLQQPCFQVSALSSCPYFPEWWTGTWKCRTSFPAQDDFGHNVYPNRKKIRTVSEAENWDKCLPSCGVMDRIWGTQKSLVLSCATVTCNSQSDSENSMRWTLEIKKIIKDLDGCAFSILSLSSCVCLLIPLTSQHNLLWAINKNILSCLETESYMELVPSFISQRTMPRCHVFFSQWRLGWADGLMQ